jgi:transposase
MENVLELYQEAFDADQPVVCFDERPTQLISEKRLPVPAEPGRVERYDYEYKREGTANIFGFFQPLAGWRHMKVTEHRCKIDFAHCMKDLVDIHFPNARRIRVVLDNLSTHDESALYEAFEPAEARRIARKLDFHFTPKHGSWLNMVEIEFSVMARQCLKSRIPSIVSLRSAVSGWQQQRNALHATVNWRFTTESARKSLSYLYPSI